MPKESKGQEETLGRVMHEFKHGTLESGSGQKVKSRRQAIAIGIKEAGASKYESASDNRRNLKQTKQKKRRRETAKHKK